MQKSKKILVFSLVYFPNPNGGAEPAIKEITDRIPETEIEFHMVTCLWNSNLPRISKVGNVLVHRIGFGIPNAEMRDYSHGKLKLNKYYFQIFGAVKAIQLNWKYKYDGLWAMMAHSCGIPAVITKTFSPNLKYILTLQEGDPKEHVNAVMSVFPGLFWLFKKSFVKADIIQSISYYLSDWAREMGYKKEIVLIKNGANPNDLNENYSMQDVEEIKNKLGKKLGDVFLVNTSRLVYQKGFDTIIEGLQYLPASIKLVCVGDGGDVEKLKSLAESLNLKDRVIFTGRVDRSVVTLYRKACDIFVAPSRSEGLGNAFVSALASRLPLITTGVGGIADYAFDDKTAWIVPAEDSKAIADKVTEIINNPEKVKLISETARKMVEEDYNWDKIAVKMKSGVFDKVL